LKILIKHIENILPGHDCVVVPGLGGFVQNRVSARLHTDSNLFYPESKDICFNANLRFNDGLLAQSYQESYDMSFEEANIEIKTAVQEILKKLEEGKYVRLGQIGTLSSNEGQLIFRPDPQNPFCPEAYGLTPFSFSPLTKPIIKKENPVIRKEKSAIRKEKLVVRKEKSVKHKKKDEFITIRLRRSRFHQLIVGAAACLFFLMLSKPAGNLSEEGQQAGMMHDYLTAPLLNQIRSAEVKKVESISTLPANSEPKMTGLIAESTAVLPVAYYSRRLRNGVKPKLSALALATSEVAEPGQTSTYYIVVSTFSRKATAEIWLSEQSDDTLFSHSGIVEENGWARVYTKSFTEKQLAQHYLTRFVAENPSFASAWVYCQSGD
jgi:hypothetical protein